jgi:hypothetical protein
MVTWHSAVWFPILSSFRNNRQTVSDEELQRSSRLSEDPGEVNAEKSFPMLNRPAQVASIDQSDAFHYDRHHANQEELPGEITTIESPTYSASLYYPMPGRSTKNGTHSNGYIYLAWHI